MATNKMIPRPTTKLHKNVSPDVNTSMDQRSFPNTRINAAWVPDKSRPSCNLPNTEVERWCIEPTHVLMFSFLFFSFLCEDPIVVFLK